MNLYDALISQDTPSVNLCCTHYILHVCRYTLTFNLSIVDKNAWGRLQASRKCTCSSSPTLFRGTRHQMLGLSPKFPGVTRHLPQNHTNHNQRTRVSSTNHRRRTRLWIYFKISFIRFCVTRLEGGRTEWKQAHLSSYLDFCSNPLWLWLQRSSSPTCWWRRSQVREIEDQGKCQTKPMKQTSPWVDRWLHSFIFSHVALTSREQQHLLFLLWIALQFTILWEY